VRWTGTLTPPRSGLYALGLLSDDGSRLYLNGKLVVDDWGDHPPTLKTAQMNWSGARPTTCVWNTSRASSARRSSCCGRRRTRIRSGRVAEVARERHRDCRCRRRHGRRDRGRRSRVAVAGPAGRTRSYALPLPRIPRSWSSRPQARPSPCPGSTRSAPCCTAGFPVRRLARLSRTYFSAMSARQAAARDFPQAPRRRTRVWQFPGHQRQGCLPGRHLDRLPLVRHTQDRAALPFGYGLFLHNLRLS